jgi:uncharacterized protein DUF4242
MPTFIDHHERMELTPEMEKAFADRLRAGQADENGVKGLNLFLTKDGGAYCLLEAPDAEAVVRTHSDGGTEIRREDVVEVRALI